VKSQLDLDTCSPYVTANTECLSADSRNVAINRSVHNKIVIIVIALQDLISAVMPLSGYRALAEQVVGIFRQKAVENI